MKPIIYILMLGTLLMSCKSELLETQPYDKLGESKFWQTESHATTGVTAIYNNLREEQVYREYYMLDNLTPIAYGYDRLEVEMAGTATPYNATYANKWMQLYKGVQRANDALANIPGIEFTNEQLKNRLIAEAKFLRALHYFNLLDFFGGVPIYEEPVLYTEANKPRNTADEVRAFISKDLTEAIAVLPESYAAADFGRATKGAAIALRGKLNLYAEDWAAAEEDFRAVMNMSYQLHPVYSELFRAETEKNSEVIFSLQHIAISGYGENMSFRLGTRVTRGSNWTNGVPSPQLVDTYEMLDGSPFNWDDVIPGFSSMTVAQKDQLFRSEAAVAPAYENRDPRLHQTIIVPYASYTGTNNVVYRLAWPFVSDGSPNFHIRHNWNANALYVWRKFVSVGDESLMREHGPIDFPIIRFADVLMMFAEARNEVLGAPDQEVLTAINRVRLRAGIPALQNSNSALPTYVSTKEQMRERIRKERAVEFASEGMYYSDIRRWEIAKQVANGPILEFTGRVLKNRVFTDRDYLWPIPQAEIDQNDELTQNPGWD